MINREIKFRALDSEDETIYFEDYTWSTADPHTDNRETMNEFLTLHIPAKWDILLVDETYAEIKNSIGKFAIHASGNGDFCNHKITFESI